MRLRRRSARRVDDERHRLRTADRERALQRACHALQRQARPQRDRGADHAVEPYDGNDGDAAAKPGGDKFSEKTEDRWGTRFHSSSYDLGDAIGKSAKFLDSFAYFLPLACFLRCIKRRKRQRLTEGEEMDPKLTLLFLLIGAIIGLSHLSEKSLARVKQQFAMRRWREFVPAWRKW